MLPADPIPELKRALGAQLAAHFAGWNADDIASLLGTDRSRVADLRREKLDRFSLETLIRFLARLQYRIELTATPTPRSRLTQAPPLN